MHYLIAYFKCTCLILCLRICYLNYSLCMQYYASNYIHCMRKRGLWPWNCTYPSPHEPLEHRHSSVTSHLSNSREKKCKDCWIQEAKSNWNNSQRKRTHLPVFRPSFLPVSNSDFGFLSHVKDRNSSCKCFLLPFGQGIESDLTHPGASDAQSPTIYFPRHLQSTCTSQVPLLSLLSPANLIRPQPRVVWLWKRSCWSH